MAKPATINNIIWDGTRWVASSKATVSNVIANTESVLHTSSDGSNWTPVPYLSDPFGGPREDYNATSPYNGTNFGYEIGPGYGIRLPRSLRNIDKVFGTTFNGNNVVALGYNTNKAAYYENGDWHETTLPYVARWTAAAYGNGRWIAVSGDANEYSNKAAISIDNGKTWSASTLHHLEQWSDIIYFPGSSSSPVGRFVAIGGGGTSYTAVLYDGYTTWQVNYTPNTGDWQTAAMNELGTRAVVLKYGTNQAAYTNNGLNWTLAPAGLPISANWTDIIFGSTKQTYTGVQGTYTDTVVYEVDAHEIPIRTFNNVQAELVKFYNTEAIPVPSQFTMTSQSSDFGEHNRFDDYSVDITLPLATGQTNPANAARYRFNFKFSWAPDDPYGRGQILVEWEPVLLYGGVGYTVGKTYTLDSDLFTNLVESITLTIRAVNVNGSISDEQLSTYYGESEAYPPILTIDFDVVNKTYQIEMLDPGMNLAVNNVITYDVPNSTDKLKVRITGVTGVSYPYSHQATSIEIASVPTQTWTFNRYEVSNYYGKIGTTNGIYITKTFTGSMPTVVLGQTIQWKILGNKIGGTTPLNDYLVGGTGQVIPVLPTFNITRDKATYTTIVPVSNYSGFKPGDGIEVSKFKLLGLTNDKYDLKLAVTSVSNTNITGVGVVSGESRYASGVRLSVTRTGDTYSNVSIIDGGDYCYPGALLKVNGIELGGGSLVANPTEYDSYDHDLLLTVTGTYYSTMTTFTYSGTANAGTPCTFNVLRNNGQYENVVANGGTGFGINQQIKITGDKLGGSTPTRDLTITVTEVAPLLVNGIYYGGHIIGYTTSGTSGQGLWVAIASDTNKLIYSGDGLAWTAITLPGTLMPKAITWAEHSTGGYYIIVGDSDKYLVSANGTQWTEYTLKNNSDWKHAIYYDGSYKIFSDSNYADKNTLLAGFNSSSWFAIEDVYQSDWTETQLDNIFYSNGKYYGFGSGIVDDKTYPLLWTSSTISTNKGNWSIYPATGTTQIISATDTGEEVLVTDGSKIYAIPSNISETNTALIYRAGPFGEPIERIEANDGYVYVFTTTQTLISPIGA